MPYLLWSVQAYQDHAQTYGFPQGSFLLQGGGVQCRAVLAPKMSQQAYGGEAQLFCKKGITSFVYQATWSLVIWFVHFSVVAWANAPCSIYSLLMINDLSNAASVGGHASEWFLAIHSHAISWLLAWLLVCLFGTLVHQVRETWKSWTVLAIDQTSDWSLAIHLLLIQDGCLLN